MTIESSIVEYLRSLGPGFAFASAMSPSFIDVLIGKEVRMPMVETMKRFNAH